MGKRHICLFEGMNMKITGIGESKNISDFVASKIAALNESEVSFRLLFDLMFREKENILYEKETLL